MLHIDSNYCCKYQIILIAKVIYESKNSLGKALPIWTNLPQKSSLKVLSNEIVCKSHFLSILMV